MYPVNERIALLPTKIRQSILADKGLSTYANNVKIITQKMGAA